MQVLLISTYELGRQPFGLASPAAWLQQSGADPTCLDLSVQRLDEGKVRGADLIAFYLPMHTATRIAMPVIDRVRALNPAAHLACYGLYAPINDAILRAHGVKTVLGGEFETGLLSLAHRLTDAPGVELPGQREPKISLEKQRFLVPERAGLPALSRYAHLTTGQGERRTVGYTEASRGCRHLCRHCPIVPVYGGQFRIVQPEVVLEDIRRQVAMGAEHITFGDPDFFNGPKHARRIVRGLHEEHPELTYDVTIKIGHLLRHADLLPDLRNTGCAFVTSAVESLDDRVLGILDKGHTCEDFLEVLRRFDDVGLALQPTFVAFTPWTSLESYRDMLGTLARLDLIDNVPPIQLAIRLLIAHGSRLLELAEVRQLVGAFDQVSLVYPWRHVDPRVDALHRQLEALIEQAPDPADRRHVFERAWDRAHALAHRAAPSVPPESIRSSRAAIPPGKARSTIPYLSEPWYC